MYYGEVSVKSECGVTSIADTVEKKIMITSVWPLQDGTNFSVAVWRKEAKGGLNVGEFHDIKQFTVKGNNKINAAFIVKTGHGIIDSLISSSAVPVFPIISGDGVETFFFFFLNKSNFETLMQTLHKHNKVEAAEFNKADPLQIYNQMNKQSVRGLVTHLSDAEFSTLKRAYHYGYFEWPRVSNLEMLSSNAHVSKVAILHHIRNAENKLLKVIFGM